MKKMTLVGRNQELGRVIIELIRSQITDKDREVYYCDYKGQRLFSNTVSLETAYMQVYGMTYQENIEKRMQQLEEGTSSSNDKENYYLFMQQHIADWMEEDNRKQKEALKLAGIEVEDGEVALERIINNMREIANERDKETKS